MLIQFLVFALCALQEFGFTVGVKVELLDLTITDMDPQYFDPKKTDCSLFEDENTGEMKVNMNITMIKSVPADTEVSFGLRGLSMGRYTVPTGIDVNGPMCELLNEPILVGPFVSAMGFSFDICPPEPGVYSVQGYTLSTETFPDEFPENKYLMLFKLIVQKKSIYEAKAYLNCESD